MPYRSSRTITNISPCVSPISPKSVASKQQPEEQGKCHGKVSLRLEGLLRGNGLLLEEIARSKAARKEETAFAATIFCLCQELDQVLADNDATTSRDSMSVRPLRLGNPRSNEAADLTLLDHFIHIHGNQRQLSRSFRQCLPVINLQDQLV